MIFNLKRTLVIKCGLCGDDSLDFEYIPQMHLLVCPYCYDFDVMLKDIIKQSLKDFLNDEGEDEEDGDDIE